MTTPCPSCGVAISARAFDCPHCGHPIRRPGRGLLGWIAKWLFILFNLLMFAWLISYFVTIGDLMSDTRDEFEQAGAAIGATMGTGLILMIWALGAVILGLATLLTRPRK